MLILVWNTATITDRLSLDADPITALTLGVVQGLVGTLQ